MYTVMMVDDEPWALQGLADILPWERLGFAIVSKCTDPQRALEKIREVHPDAVFTDIRMPGMSGLDLIGAVRTEKIPSEFIIISSYDDFAAAQKAITYDVCQFILKPFNPDEVRQAVGRLSEKLAQKAGELFDLSADSPEIPARLLQALDQPGEAPCCCVVVSDSPGALPEPSEAIRFIPARIHGYAAAGLLTVKKTETGCIRALQDKAAPDSSVGMSRCYPNFSRPQQMAAEAREALEGNFKYSDNPVVADIQAYLCRKQTAGVSLRDVSGKFFLSETYLCELFKKHTGITLVSFIKSIRISRAARMIRLTDAGLKEIAEEVGYQDYNYFGRLFKNKFGVAPENYRNALKGGGRQG